MMRRFRIQGGRSLPINPSPKLVLDLPLRVPCTCKVSMHAWRDSALVAHPDSLLLTDLRAELASPGTWLRMCSREFEGREFACRPLPHVFHHLERSGFSLNELLEGVTYPRSHLLDVTERIDWDSLRVICANLSKRCSPAQIVELGQASLQSRSMRFLAVFARLLLTPNEYYRFAARELNRYCACLGASMRHVGDQRLECQVFIQPGYVTVPEVFLALQGAFIGMTQIYGDQPAEVEMQQIEGGAIYRIRIPQSRGLLSTLRRVATWTLTARAAARNLQDANELLHERHSALLRKDAALAESERNYRSLLDQAFDPVLIIESDGRISGANQRACEAFGVSRDELEARSPSEWIEVAEVHRRKFFVELREKRAARIEAIARRRDGSWFSVEVGCSILTDGRVQAVMRDISERQRVEQERQQYASELERQVLARTRELERANHELKELQARLIQAEVCARSRL